MVADAPPNRNVAQGWCRSCCGAQLLRKLGDSPTFRLIYFVKIYSTWPKFKGRPVGASPEKRVRTDDARDSLVKIQLCRMSHQQPPAS